MRLLGIDFGTSNTVAMVRASGGRTRPLLFDGSPLLPSAVYLPAEGEPLAGRDAERAARIDPAGFEPNPKRRIDDGTVLLGERELPVHRLVGVVLDRVVAEVRRQLGGLPDELWMTHPAGWGERRRSVLVAAARSAGLPNPRLVTEPVAAASYYTAVLGSAVPAGRALAIYDLGGGTFDATVVRRTSTGFEVLAEHGLTDLGGLDFDHAIVEHLGATYASTADAADAERFEAWRRLINPVEAVDRRGRALLYDDVRGAKETLSRTTSADVHLPGLGVDAHLTRDELEGLVRPYLAMTVSALAQTVAAARLTPGDLVGIFLVGGSSRIPLAAHLIHTELGVPPTTLEQPETVVAEGALYLAPGAALAHTGTHSGIPRPVIATAAVPLKMPVSPAFSAQPVSPAELPTATISLSALQPASPPPASPQASSRADKPWYAEPVILATMVVLIFVVIAFVVLIWAANQ
jgi:molecular chaperone DnaK (HSP70)